LEITPFLRIHRDELEVLKGFFSSKCPLEKSGLEIFLNEAGRIVVRPHFQFYPPYDSSQVQIFGEYTYVEGEGFCEIPYEKRVPESYVREKTIAISDETYFVLYELDALKDCIFSIQKELKKPKDLFVRVRELQKSGRTKAAEWLLEAVFETEIGTVDLYDIWQGVQENKRYIFTSAGLLLLKTPRFSWLKNIPKKRWLKEGKQLRMSTMEWLRLTVFEDLRPPLGTSVEDNQTRELIQKLTSFKTDQSIDLTGFKSDLRSYQEVGVRWLWFMYLHGLSGLLCDEMGLGKTHQAMGLIAAAQNIEAGKKILVVCPTSVIYHWQELLKNFLPEARVLIFYGISRKLEDFHGNAEILVTSYGTLRSEKQALSEIEFEIAIYDELQIAKNAQSQTHKALKKIKAGMRIGLTGTPIENRLLELKAIFDVVLPGYLPHDANFKELFVNPIEKNQDAEKKMLLSKLIKPFLLRRKKSEVLLELPEKIEEISYCDLSDEQLELYKKTFVQQKATLMQDLENQSKPVPYLHVFALLSTLKQICDHPCLITKQYSEFQKHKSGKWDLFVELLQETRDSGQKLVIFSQYLDMLDMMEVYMKDNKIGYAGIRGSTRNRKEQLDRFRDDPTCEVFLASLQAVGVGVDLVSASVVIHYDRWWNPARENQATDRVHRIGQNRGVQVFKLVTKGTIEEHIHHLIEKKLTLMEGVLGFDEQDQIKGLDRDELLQLLWLINKDLEDETLP
jgi:SNF2 family DNA or RNA helicase